MAKKLPELTFEELIQRGDEYFLPHLSVDCVIFGFHNNELKVLLLEWKETRRWCLPGGFIQKEEHMDDAANRILKSRTGLDKIFLKQFHAFGDPLRDRKKHGFRLPKDTPKSWLWDRFVTVGYWALVEFQKVIPTPDEASESCQWCDIANIPELILDHNEIVLKALESLRREINDYPIGRDLLPVKFTMPELQRMYETILGKTLDRRNFQKKMLALDILERLKEIKRGGAHKAPYLYRFDPKKYERAMKEGLRTGL